MKIYIFSSYNDLEFHVSKREQLNYCRFEALLRIAVWGLFIFRGGTRFSRMQYIFVFFLFEIIL